jgi:hypothetical protein
MLLHAGMQTDRHTDRYGESRLIGALLRLLIENQHKEREIKTTKMKEGKNRTKIEKEKN